MQKLYTSCGISTNLSELMRRVKVDEAHEVRCALHVHRAMSHSQLNSERLQIVNMGLKKRESQKRWPY
jgi:hypothetical protein